MMPTTINKELKMADLITSSDIFAMAKGFTDKCVNNIVDGWERDDEAEQVVLFNSLVRLGDSRQLAAATTIAKKYNKKGGDMYRAAYHS